ncbi:MAG: ATP-binding protein [Clostridiales bacterium]|nr:ATP-binding protein [Clostridiales bacterium]
MQITTGCIETAQKVVVYGPEGIGKSTLASQFPKPLFIDTEGSSKRLNVSRTHYPSSWSMLISLVEEFKRDAMGFQTLVLDTADWAEMLAINHVLNTILVNGVGMAGIEDYGYGKGYVYVAEAFGRLLNLLTDVVRKGINVVVTAHAQMRKFEQPHEMGAYDRWELKCSRRVAALLKEWADMVLFANFETFVINVDNQGAQKGKNKATGSKRVIYTVHHACWDAKNRHDLPDKIDLEYSKIAHLIPATINASPSVVPPAPAVKEVKKEVPAPVTVPEEAPDVPLDSPLNPEDVLPDALLDLMKPQKVTVDEIKQAVSFKGYYPLETPISRYDPAFVSGVLIGAWPQVEKIIIERRGSACQQIAI